MNEDMMRKIWEKASQIEGLDPDLFRKDACGAIMSWSHFGQNTSFGWVVDHIYPKSKGGDDNEANLRAMNIANDRSKGDDYPVYRSALTMGISDNVPNEKEFRVNSKLQSKLADLYGLSSVSAQ